MMQKRPAMDRQAAHRLDVMCIHVQARLCDSGHAVQVALEVWHKGLHQQAPLGVLLEVADGGCDVAGPPIWQVVPVHAGEHHVVDAPFRHCPSCVLWLHPAGAGRQIEAATPLHAAGCTALATEVCKCPGPCSVKVRACLCSW